VAGLADLFPEEKPVTCFLQIVTNNIVYTVLNTTLYTALYTTVCTVLSTTVCTVLCTVLYTILYTDAKSGITKFIVFLTEHSTVNLPQYPSV
jgi:hypothetical protein